MGKRFSYAQSLCSKLNLLSRHVPVGVADDEGCYSLSRGRFAASAHLGWDPFFSKSTKMIQSAFLTQKLASFTNIYFIRNRKH